MKMKVNVNRKRISSEEIATHRNFRSLIKSYPFLTNPFRRTSWRTKGILWVVVASVLLIWYVTGGNEFERYEPNRIFIHDLPIDLSGHDQLRKDIKERMVRAVKISGPIKGIRIELEMISEFDTVRIVSFGGGKYFLHKEHYFESSEDLLPDSLQTRLIR